MWDDYENGGVREDAHAKLKAEIEDLAIEHFFEIRVIGGLLKFTPFGIYTKVFLELERGNFWNYPVIYSHRTLELTRKYKGKAVSTEWLAGFLKANAPAAKELLSTSEVADTIIQKKATTDAIQRKSCQFVSRTQCRSCSGEGHWRAGDPRDGDARFEYCAICRGAGYVDT